MLFKVECIEHHTGSDGRPESTLNSSRASFGSGDKSTCLVDQRPKGFRMLPYDIGSGRLKREWPGNRTQG